MSNLFARRAGLLCATPRPRTPRLRQETSGSADSSSSACFRVIPLARSICRPYTVCTVVGRCPASLLSIPHGPLPTPAAASACPTSNSCRATTRCSDAKNRQRCSAPAVPLPPESGEHRLPPRNCRWFQPGEATYNARIIANTNRKPGIDVVSRLIAHAVRSVPGIAASPASYYG